MAFIKRGRTKRLVLDIGTSAIRLCELTATKAGYQLTRYYQRDLNIDPTMEEEDKTDRRREVLQELLKEAKIRTKKTIVAVPGQSVFTRNRPLPPVPEYKVTQIVKYEIQQQIPFSLDQIALDYQVLDRTEAGGYDVMMAAIKVDVVEKHLEILRKTRRRIDVVDVSPIAAYNWLRHTGEFGEDGQCVALLDLGATTTDIVIQKEGQFKFTRSLHIGGNDITTAISSNFNMGYEDAERLKREKGFAPTGDPKRDGRGGQVIGQVLSRLVGEINRSFAYFRSQPGGGPVTRVVVTGGGACLKNIIPYLQNQLHIEVRIAQPLAGIVVSPKAIEASEYPEQACVALGLALRCCQPVPIQINLIPPRVLEIARQKEQVFYWVLSLATMCLIMASTIPVTAAKTEQAQERIKLLKNVIKDYDVELIDNPLGNSPFEDEFQFIKADVKSFQSDVADLDDLRGNRNFWLPYVQAINDARPIGGGVAISSIEAIVIGGAKNTGKKFRNRGKAGAGVEEEVENEPAAAAAANPMMARFGGRGGPGGRMGGPGGMMGGRMGGPGGMMGSAGVFGNANQVQGQGALNIIGFPGIFPTKVLEPNGFTIFGYAKDIETVIEFVASLEEQEKFIKGGVYWDKAYSNDVPDYELDNARITGGTRVQNRGASGGRGGPPGGMMGGGPGGMMGGGPGGMMGGGPGGMMGRAGMMGGSSFRGQRGQSYTGETVTSFHIDLQFFGDPQKQPN